jgi:hypothetical protein
MIVDKQERLDAMVGEDLAAQAADQRGGQLTT